MLRNFCGLILNFLVLEKRLKRPTHAYRIRLGDIEWRSQSATGGDLMSAAVLELQIC